MSNSAGEGLWEEFDRVNETKISDNYQRAGLTEEILNRLLSRGIRIDEITFDSDVEGTKVTYDYTPIEDTPAYRLWKQHSENTDMSEIEKTDRTTRFFNNAKTDTNDEHFRTQWADLYPEGQ